MSTALRVIRIVCVVIFVSGIAGMIISSINGNNVGLVTTIGLITAVAAIVLLTPPLWARVADSTCSTMRSPNGSRDRSSSCLATAQTRVVFVDLSPTRLISGVARRE